MWGRTVASVGESWLALCLSFAASGIVLALVFWSGAGGRVVASPSADDPVPHDGAGFLALHLSGLPGDPAVALPRDAAETPVLTVWPGPHDCPNCMAADPEYDPEVGSFFASFSAPFTGTLAWNRAPFTTNNFPMGNYGQMFQFWPHRQKGCGDFQIWGVDANGQPATNIAPFGVSCTGSLARDTVVDRWGDYAGVFPPEPFDPAAADHIFYGDGPAYLTVTVQNRTVTRMQGQYLNPIRSEPPIDPSAITFMPLGPQVIEPGASVPFQHSVDGGRAWSSAGIAPASPARITATLVFSFGPTARMTQTMVLARPEMVFLPVSEKGWDGGW